MLNYADIENGKETTGRGMAEGKTGFFARLFGRRRRKDDFEPSLAHALAATIRKALAHAVGRELLANSEPLSLDDMMEDLQRRCPGWTTFFFQDSDTPRVVLVMPDDWLKTIAPEGKELSSVASAICEGAADFLSFGAPASFLNFQDRYEQGDVGALSWRLSGTVPFRIRTGDGPPLFACVTEQAARELEVSLEDKKHQEALREFLRNPAPREPAAAPKTLRVQSPRELLLASLFLPPRVECGKQVLQTSCTAVATGVDAKLTSDAPGVWAAAGCQRAGASQGKRLAQWYFFPCADSDMASKVRETCKEIAGCLFRGSLPALSEALGGGLEKPTLGLDAKPDLGGRSGYLLLSAAVHLSSARIPVEVYIDTTALSPLLRRHCDPAAITATARSSGGALPLALALNHRLLARGLLSFPRQFHDRRLGEGFFPFSGFADLITERDLSLLLQNYLPRALEGRPMRSLYSWREQDIVTPHIFDEEKLSRHMTPRMREAWQRDQGESLGSRDEYLEWNRDALLAIEKAARRQALLLSPRARYILSEIIVPPLRAQARKRMEDVAASGIPFVTLRSMSAPLVQRFLGTRSDRAICLGIMGSEAELPFIRKHVSAARASRLEEDLLLARKQLESGDMEWGEALRARTEMEKAAKDMIESVSKQGQRGSERRR